MLALNVAMVLFLNLDVLLYNTAVTTAGVILKVATGSLCLYFVLQEVAQVLSAKSVLAHFNDF